MNSSLEFKARKNVSHGQGKVGELTIPVGQSNFTTNGRYYVRVRSSTGSSAMVSIHLVNETAPTMKLKESAVSGKNLHFEVENMVYGITQPVERVTLTDPAGDTKELTMIDDWYLIGDLFVLYNDVEAENGRNNIPYNGTYTITVYSNGFKNMSKSFVVTGGDSSPGRSGRAKMAVAFDAVSRATSSSGGSSGSGDGGSSYTAADLLFDTDLLVNAMILNELGEQNDAVIAVMDYWNSMSYDAVLDIGDTVYYDWTDYIDEVEAAKVNNTVLTFEAYKEDCLLYTSDAADE